MREADPRLGRDDLHPFANYAVIATLAILVLMLAWLQFTWLNDLRQEEEARRRVALRVASANYTEFIAQEINLLLERVQTQGSVAAAATREPLLRTVFEIDAAGAGTIRTAADGTWQPATRAQMHQQLGWPLLAALARGPRLDGAALWLDPPAVILCRQRCQAGVLDAAQLGAAILAPAAQRVFSEFGGELRSVVTYGAGAATSVLHPPGVRARDLRIADLQQDLLENVPRLGPEGTRWVLTVNHGGSSLEAAVARSHVRNMLLSGGLLSVLALGIGLVVLNARRQTMLARRQLYFAAGISHELRTPLSVISTAADNLADRTVDDVARAHEYGALIQRETRRLRAMIENVLQFAQSSSATRPRARTEIDVSRLLDDVLERCAGMLGERELRLDVGDALPTVRGDPAALASALTNLIANAAQYASGGNWVEVSATAVRVRPRGRALRVTISNPVTERLETPPGKLFEPFYRGARARAAGIAGTGIGLSVARNVARQHGGDVSVDAGQPGIVKFMLFLPVEERDRATVGA